MNSIVFWSVLAFFYLILSIITGKGLCKLKKKLNILEDPNRVSMGYENSDGSSVEPIEILYKTLIGILITEIIGFILAAIGAILSII